MRGNVLRFKFKLSAQANSDCNAKVNARRRQPTIEFMDVKQFRRISKAIADPQRYKILTQIARSKREITCAESGSDLGLTAATLSHHIKELQSAGLIDIRRQGRCAYLKLRRAAWRAYLAQLAKIG
jgi:ArsR family transcriptional regulator